MNSVKTLRALTLIATITLVYVFMDDDYSLIYRSICGAMWVIVAAINRIEYGSFWPRENKQQKSKR